MSRAIDAVQVLNDINSHHRPTPVSEFESGFNSGLNQAMSIIRHAPTLTLAALRGLDRVTAEREGAIEDLEEIMFKGSRNIDTCEYCKNAKCYARGGIQVCNPVWRGIKEG